MTVNVIMQMAPSRHPDLLEVPADVQAVLAELATMRLESAAAYVALECERLDAAQLALFQHLETGDPQIIHAWVKVSESRRKLLGKPTG